MGSEHVLYGITSHDYSKNNNNGKSRRSGDPFVLMYIHKSKRTVVQGKKKVQKKKNGEG